MCTMRGRQRMRQTANANGSVSRRKQCGHTALRATFAADLELKEAEATGQRRFEQLIEVGGNSTHRAARRTEQQDAGTAVSDLHAATVHSGLCARGCSAFRLHKLPAAAELVMPSQAGLSGACSGRAHGCALLGVVAQLAQFLGKIRGVVWARIQRRLPGEKHPSVKSNWTMGLPSAMYSRILFIGVLVVHLMGAIGVHAHVRGAHEFPQRHGGNPAGELDAVVDRQLTAQLAYRHKLGVVPAMGHIIATEFPAPVKPRLRAAARHLVDTFRLPTDTALSQVPTLVFQSKSPVKFYG